jgi:ribose transport system permease protein
MTDTIDVEAAAAAGAAATTAADGDLGPGDGSAVLERLRRGLLSGRYGGVWILAGLVVLFGVAETETFLTTTTLRTILSDQAVTGLLALSVLLPFVAGHVDLSFVNVAGLAVILSAWLSTYTALSTPLIVLAVVAAAAAVGLVNGLFVSRLGVNSLFITLGVGSVVAGVMERIADHRTIPAVFGEPYASIARKQTLDLIPYMFVIVLGLAALLHYLLEHTQLGRRLQACGGNPAAARLAGIRVNRITIAVFLVSSMMAALTGFLLAAKIGLGTETTTGGLLLPAASILFLGATQHRERPNVPGTLLAMLIMGTGIKGFQLMGASAWVVNFFAGSVLLLAVVISRGRVGRVR